MMNAAFLWAIKSQYKIECTLRLVPALASRVFFYPNDASLLASISNVLTMRGNITKINGKYYMQLTISLTDHLLMLALFLLQTVLMIQKIPE